MILVATTLIVSVVLFYSGMYLTGTTKSILEFGQARSMLKDIAIAKLNSILHGSKVEYYLSYDTVGIGYRRINRVIEIDIDQSGLYTKYTIDGLYTIYIQSNRVLTGGRNIIYGDPHIVMVNDTRRLPVIIEYNNNIGSVVELYIDKIFYTIYQETSENGTTITIQLSIPRIVRPRITGKYLLEIYSTVNTTLTKVYNGTSYFKVIVNGTVITSSDDLLRRAGIDPASIESFTLVITIYDIHLNIL
jgi:hypothetical protein